MTLMSCCALAGFLLWASQFEIDQTVRAQGQLIPAGRTQVIQATDGGALLEILVQEGELVTQGQRLAVLEQARSQAALEESQAKQSALQAALSRAQAEADGRRPALQASDKDPFAAVQLALYEQRQRGLEQELSSLTAALEAAQLELAVNEALLRSGDTSKLEVMRAARQVSDVQGRINSVRNKFMQEVRTEVAKLSEELASNRYRLDDRQAVMDHTVVRAPVSGIVKYLKVNTVGGVLRAGDELMHISPTTGGLLAEVKIHPVDAALAKPGMVARIRFDAFDSAIYGSLVGTLSYVSADTFSEQAPNGQAIAYYRAHVRLDQLQRNRALERAQLKPGMTVTVDVLARRRSVLQYLTSPLYKAFDGALSER
jgi:adhesin transport system membrane fusion protein